MKQTIEQNVCLEVKKLRKKQPKNNLISLIRIIERLKMNFSDF